MIVVIAPVDVPDFGKLRIFCLLISLLFSIRISCVCMFRSYNNNSGEYFANGVSRPCRKKCGLASDFTNDQFASPYF